MVKKKIKIEISIPEDVDEKKLRMVALLLLATIGKKPVSDKEAEEAVKRLTEEIN